MPIYAYKCQSCGFAKDVLQKMSDPLLSVCPSCGQSSFQKQVTAAGFQLKGSGWYVTDFKNNTGAAAKPTASTEGDAAAAPATEADAAKPGSAAADTTPSTAAAPASSPATSSPATPTTNTAAKTATKSAPAGE